MNQNQKIKRIVESYTSIINLDEIDEVMYLIADLDTLMREEINNAKS